MSGTNEEPESLAASASLFDHRDRDKVRHYGSFVVGSARRHRFFFGAVFVAIVGATIGSLYALPKTYHVEAKVVAQANAALTVRGDGPGADSLTRVAAETVLRRDNLVALVQQTDLLQYNREHRAPAQRARDALVKALHVRQASEADRLDGLVDLLEKRLSVWTNDSGSTVTISLDWSDAPMACRLVDAAQRAFLDARYAREITALAESIAILRGHTTSLKADIDEAVGEIERMRLARDGAKVDVAPPIPPSRPRAPSMQRPVVARAPISNVELQKLKVQNDAKLHVIDELEEFRRHRLSELQARLVEARATFTENHPTIVDLKEQMSALSVESPQVSSLRQEAASSNAEYDRRVTSLSETPVSGVAPALTFATPPASAAGTPPRLSGEVLRLDADLREDRDPAMVYARGQLRDAMDKYATLRTQIQTAQIDLETAQAAFKYRYSVVTAAHLPRNPTKPNVPLVVLAAIIAALFCGCLFTVLVDVRKGRLLERWQIERLLDRPILGEIALPRLDDPDLE